MTAAFNVGVRRARGEFVLVTTPDILFSNELIEFLASEELDKEAMYGIDRHDVKRDVVLLPTLEQQLAYCQRNIIIVNNVGSCYFGSSQAPVLNRQGCGDFIIFSRERWHLLHGYPEIDIVSLYADSIVNYMAYLSGAREIILHEPMRIYHMDHEARRAKSKRKLLGSLKAIGLWFIRLKRLADILERLATKLFPPKNKLDIIGVPYLSDAQYQSIVLDMIKGKRPYIYNDENWGLGRESLEEFVVSTADWDKEYDKDK
jgi:glycosyltransferase involved in cell wall biosynthesis